MKHEIERYPGELRRLREAAQAVVNRWETPSWKDVPATAHYIDALRLALTQPEQEAQMPYPFGGTIKTKLTQDENGEPLIVWSCDEAFRMGASSKSSHDTALRFYTDGELAGSVDFPGPAEKPEQRLRVDNDGEFRPEPYPKCYENREEFEEAQEWLMKKLKQPDNFVYSEDYGLRFNPATGNAGIGTVSEKSKPSCPPCNHNCNEGRDCPAREQP